MPIDRDGDGPPLRREAAKPSASRPDDLRATPFTDDVFDDDYYGRRRGRGGSFGLIVAVIFGASLAAFAGWYFLGARDAGLVAEGGAGKDGVVRADPNPYKIKPEDPGGHIENQDKAVYDRLDKTGKPASRVENLLPEPEQPKAPPVKKAEAPPVQKAQPTASGTDDPLAKLVEKVVGPGEPPPAPATPQTAPAAAAPASAVPPPVPPAVVASGPMTPIKPLPPTSPAPVPAASAPTAEVAAPPAAPATTSPAPAPAAPVQAAAPPAQPAPPAPTQIAEAAVVAVAPQPESTAPATPVVAGPGAMFLQLASARSEEAAMGEWKRIIGKNSDVLIGLSPSVVTADLGEKGTYYRLRAGPVADKAAAETLCASLASRNVGCIVVRP